MKLLFKSDSIVSSFGFLVIGSTLDLLRFSEVVKTGYSWIRFRV